MTRIFWLLCLFLLNSLGFSQDQNPSFESLSQNTPSASVQKSVSLSQSFTQVSEQFLSLRNLFEALPLLLDPGAREVFPKASLSLKKEISQKALEISSTVAGIQDEDFKALKQSLLELGSDSVKLEDIPGILIELDSRLLNIGQKLFLNPAFPETTVLPRINLQAALLLLQNLKTQDFSSNQSGLKTLLHDLIQVLEIKNDPIYGVVQKILEDTTKVFDAKLLTPALSQITRIFESVLHQKDGRDPWHPPIPIPQDLSPTQKDQIIAHALNTSSRPGFFQRAQSTVTNFLIPAAHAQTQTQNLPNRDLGTARKRLVKLPNGSEYRGDLVGNLPHGRGWLKNSNGTSFVGDWVLGKPHGHGVLQLHKGNLYSGEIHNGIPQGTGSFTAPDGSVYQGAVLNGRPHGEGKIIFPNGIVIEAEFENGIPDGIALLRDGFGNTSEFSFVDGEPLGDARIFTQGLVLDGWLNGSFDDFEIMGVSDRFGNFLEVFQDDATESENDSEISSSTSEDLPSAPLYETSSQRISVARFVAYETGFECNWNGEVSPFGQNQRLAPHGYGEIS
ncbi:MAG: hypothetical protein H3C47_15185, partial [Candidatus Cloacimonetes bacterium]|nr:hypothetical protein [Candidatus Cloacimonadota bacterium]